MIAGQADTIAKAKTFLRERGAGVALEALFNFILPLVVYDMSRHGLGDVGALLASSIPPIAWSLFLLARDRRIDAVSILVLAGIALSLLAFLGGGSIRFLQLRERMITALIGLVFLGSAAIGKPLIYQLARAGMMRRAPSELKEFEALRDNVHFRRAMTIMTLAWGFGLVGEAAVSVALVFNLSVHDYLIAGPLLGYGTTGGLGLWTFLYARAGRRRGEARRAAEADAAQAAGPL
jgi:hypothetical protein